MLPMRRTFGKRKVRRQINEKKMKKAIYILIWFFVYNPSYGQDYQRIIIDYSKQSVNDSTACLSNVLNEIQEVSKLIENLQSEKSAVFAKDIFDKSPKCPALFETYAWALFRSGEWMKSIEIIDSAISVYGSNPDLVLKRGYMNIEMAELGVGKRNIDGNRVYLAKDKQLNFEESNFKKQNYLAALNDFKYLADNYYERFREIYITGYIYQKLENYDNSNVYLSKLLNNPEYADNVILTIVDNYTGLKKFDEAEKFLLELEKKYSHNANIQQKLSELYEITGNEEKQKSTQLKAQFYIWVPDYCDLEYSEDNYNNISFFLLEKTPNEKLNKLKEIQKGDVNRSIDILISVLNIHGNHGNGIEEETAKMLIEIGDSVVPKTIHLLNNAQSTCTVTMAASILAELKDPRGWQPMIDYLPRMENLPFTITPPDVPAQIIKFDKKKGLIALVGWIKGQVAEEDQPTDNPLDELGGIFALSSIYSPLSVYKKNEVIKTARNLKYTREEVRRLLDKIYGNN